MSQVAVLRTSPSTVLADYHELMNLAQYQDVIAKDADGNTVKDTITDNDGEYALDLELGEYLMTAVPEPGVQKRTPEIRKALE